MGVAWAWVAVPGGGVERASRGSQRRAWPASLWPPEELQPRGAEEEVGRSGHQNVPPLFKMPRVICGRAGRTRLVTQRLPAQSLCERLPVKTNPTDQICVLSDRTQRQGPFEIRRAPSLP